MRDIKVAANFAVKHGFNLVQFSLDFSRYFPENIPLPERAEIKNYFKSAGVELGFHGPSDVSLMNRHDLIREAGIKRIFQMLDLAIDLNGKYFVFHPGRLAFYSLGKKEIVFMERRFPEKHIELFSSSVRKILEYVDGKIKIYIENTNSLPAQFLKAISRLAIENGLRLAWDVGHTENLPPNDRAIMLKFYSDNIKHVELVHLHDTTEVGGHKALGTGDVNVSAYLEIISTIKADMVLEIFPESGLIDSIKYLNGLKQTSNAN